jgi:hypothetical protein
VGRRQTRMEMMRDRRDGCGDEHVPSFCDSDGRRFVFTRVCRGVGGTGVRLMLGARRELPVTFDSAEGMVQRLR